MPLKAEPKSVLNWYLEFTSVGGLTQVVASQDQFWKKFWTLLTLIGTGMTIWSVWLTFDDLMQFRVTTDITISRNYTIKFPVVTICNANRVHCGNLHSVLEACDKNETCFGSRMNILCSLFELTGCNVSVTQAEIFQYENLTSDLSICRGKVFSEIKELHTSLNQVDLDEAFFKTYLNLTRDEILSIAHSPEKMIKDCTFAGNPENSACQELKSTKAKVVTSPRLGVCYMYNFGTGLDPIGYLTTNGDGPDYGLSLTIDIESGYYMRYGMSTSDGVSIVLAQQNQLPNVLSSPLKIAPSTETDIVMTPVEITRIESPYTSKCVTKYSDEMKKKLPENLAYSEATCKNICMSQQVRLACNCSDPLLYEARIDSVYNGKRFCSTKYSDAERKCADSASQNISHSDKSCTCGQSCNTLMYQIAVSHTRWPSEKYWSIIAQRFNVTYKNQLVTYNKTLQKELSGEEQTNYTILRSTVAENYLKVNVYFGTMALESITESKKYSFYSFLSTLGGSMSLFLGITFVTVFELIELIVLLVIPLIKK